MLLTELMYNRNQIEKLLSGHVVFSTYCRASAESTLFLVKAFPACFGCHYAAFPGQLMVAKRKSTRLLNIVLLFLAGACQAAPAA